MLKVDKPKVTSPDGMGKAIEIVNAGIFLTVQIQDDGYVHGVMALAPEQGSGEPVMVVDFHSQPGEPWTVHTAEPLEGAK